MPVLHARSPHTMQCEDESLFTADGPDRLACVGATRTSFGIRP